MGGANNKLDKRLRERLEVSIQHQVNGFIVHIRGIICTHTW